MDFKTILSVLILLLLFSNSSAQIKGKIQESADQYPLEYATVALYNQLDNSLITGVITNEEGVFVISETKYGIYYIEASFVGYATKTIRNIEISKIKPQIDLGVIELVLGNQLNEVVVKSDRQTVVHKIERQVFDSKNFQSNQGGNAVDVIKNLPSVTFDGQGEISVRGSKGYTVLLNGKPTQGDVSAILAQLPANAIENV